jgi:hypothetical protein
MRVMKSSNGVVHLPEVLSGAKSILFMAFIKSHFTNFLVLHAVIYYLFYHMLFRLALRDESRLIPEILGHTSWAAWSFSLLGVFTFLPAPVCTPCHALSADSIDPTSQPAGFDPRTVNSGSKYCAIFRSFVDQKID